MVKQTRASANTRSDDSLLSVRRTALSLAVAAALPGAMTLPSVAVAQGNDDVIEEVVTTGYRSSLRNDRSGGVRTEFHGNLFTGLAPAPDLDRLVALDDHVAVKDAVDLQRARRGRVFRGAYG